MFVHGGGADAMNFEDIDFSSIMDRLHSNGFGDLMDAIATDKDGVFETNQGFVQNYKDWKQQPRTAQVSPTTKSPSLKDTLSKGLNGLFNAFQSRKLELREGDMIYVGAPIAEAFNLTFIKVAVLPH
jgi:hypothetical protein